MSHTKGIFISAIGYILSISMLVMLSPTIEQLIDDTSYVSQWNNGLRDMIELTAILSGSACTICLFVFIKNNLLTNKNH